MFAIVGAALMNAKGVSAFGSGEQYYCTIGYDDAQFKKCAVVLAYFHPDVSWTREEIGKKVQVSVNYYAGQNQGYTSAKGLDKIYEYYGDRDDLMKQYGLSTSGVAKAISDCSKYQAGESSCIRSVGNPGNFTEKVGKPAIPICYTDYYSLMQFKNTCDGKITPGGGEENPNNPSGGNNNNGGGAGSLNTDVPGSEKCSTLFPNEWCSADGIGSILTFVVAVLTGTVVVAGTVGIIICAVLILTARDNEQQLATGKKRLMEVVIGMIAWIMLSVLVNLFIPKTSKKIETEAQNAMIINGGEEKA